MIPTKTGRSERETVESVPAIIGRFSENCLAVRRRFSSAVKIGAHSEASDRRNENNSRTHVYMKRPFSRQLLGDHHESSLAAAESIPAAATASRSMSEPRGRRTARVSRSPETNGEASARKSVQRSWLRSALRKEFDDDDEEDDEEFDEENVGAISSSECSVSLLRRKVTSNGWMGCTRINRRQTLSWLTAGSELSE